ncbi:ubiquinol-cytochrome c reductase iron-sulfur subunit [Candidatus Poribacteria bacterium]|nr:ubiquinol-cytochrome c reductase iron-sulfur subunit [Candidatus Poribacteria bacterium]
MSSLRKPQPVPRRDFLGAAALMTCGATLGLATVGMARLPFPAVIAGESSKIKIGRPDDIAMGEERWVPSARAFVFRDKDGVHAISGVCTHLGCIVSRAPTGFACPCHGSRFGPQGEVTKGPAPSALPWLEISLAPDGQLVVDVESRTATGSRFRV